MSPPNPKHSNTNTSSGFSMRNPVSSFRSWVSQKKSSREDSATMNHSSTTYGKIDTSPTPRKSSISSEPSKRNRTNSATASQPTSINPNHHPDVQNNSSATSNSSSRVKKKSSFAFRSANPIALLKRTAETNHQPGNSSSPEQSGTAGGGGSGPLGYLKNLVRGDSSVSEKKQ